MIFWTIQSCLTPQALDWSTFDLESTLDLEYEAGSEIWAGLGQLGSLEFINLKYFFQFKQ